MSGHEDRPKQAEATVQDEPFLRRWSRLKKESREVPPEEAARSPEEPAGQPPAGEAESAPSAAPAPGEPPAAEPLELPPLDTLNEESDFGAFMRAGVDPDLRRLALRKMFRNPKYGVVDELDPFRADFAAFTPLGDIVTADMKFHAERLLRKEMEKAAEAAEDAGTSSPEAGEAEAGESTDVRAADAAAESAAEDEQTAQDDSTNPTEDADERRDA
jgi:hypothetical protein